MQKICFDCELMFELSDEFARGLNLKLETGGPLIKNTITLEQLLKTQHFRSNTNNSCLLIAWWLLVDSAAVCVVDSPLYRLIVTSKSMNETRPNRCKVFNSIHQDTTSQSSKAYSFGDLALD